MTSVYFILQNKSPLRDDESPDKDIILTWDFESYPSFHICERIWLEVRNYPMSRLTDIKELEQTCYEIVDVQHSLKIEYMKEIIKQTHIDVYLRKLG